MRAVLAVFMVASSMLCFAQNWPKTRAELTNYDETSHYSDVIAFLQKLQHAGAPISVRMMGKSAEGREMPLVIASYPPISSAAEARRSGKPIVYVQANIHAGEVEGKEAALMVLRRLSQDPKGLLSKIVLLVTPIYNLDGNEKFAPVERNRPEQDGPREVGVRANGQGLDLNRDAIKAESPEMRGVLEYVYTTWDPDLMMDLHTTDGTRHGWELTYSPPLNPNTDPGVMRLSRDIIIPAVRRQIERETGKLLFDYGNAETRQGKQAWYSFEPFGRYCTNYVGLRNRIAILSEATTYIPFKARVEITYWFVMGVLDWVAAHPKQVIEATRGADLRMAANPPKELGVRFDVQSRGSESVLLESKQSQKELPEQANPGRQKVYGPGRPKMLDEVKMPVYDRFLATRMAAFPVAYLIPPTETKIVELLKRHGIVVEKLVEPWTGSVSQFTIKEVKQAERPFQGHRLIELNGDFYSLPERAAAGTYVVKTNQPLGVLAFQILEPEGQDGAAAWGFLGETFKIGDRFPILKVMSPVIAATLRE